MLLNISKFFKTKDRVNKISKFQCIFYYNIIVILNICIMVLNIPLSRLFQTVSNFIENIFVFN